VPAQLGNRKGPPRRRMRFRISKTTLSRPGSAINEATGRADGIHFYKVFVPGVSVLEGE
jgi:hypothetical protein